MIQQYRLKFFSLYFHFFLCVLLSCKSMYRMHAVPTEVRKSVGVWIFRKPTYRRLWDVMRMLGIELLSAIRTVVSGLSTEPPFQPSFFGLNLRVVFADWLRTHTRESQRVIQSICSLVRNLCQCQGVVTVFEVTAQDSVSLLFLPCSFRRESPLQSGLTY